MVQLGKLRREADEEPKNAEKQAEYLQLLNKRDPREVIARVESREVSSSWLAGAWLRAMRVLPCGVPVCRPLSLKHWAAAYLQTLCAS